MENAIEILRVDFAKCKEAISSRLETALKEIDEFRFEYNCDLDKIDMQVIYDDLRQLRAWRNRLAHLLSLGVRSQHRVGGILVKITELAQSMSDESLIKNASFYINKAWAIQERAADARLAALSALQLEVVVRDFYEYVKIVVKLLYDKRTDLRDAFQEVQAVQALLALAVGTSE